MTKHWPRKRATADSWTACTRAWISSCKDGSSPRLQTEKKQAVQRFQKGLELYKEAYRSAQQAIDEVFRDDGPPAANPTAPSA